ncbi:MAG: Hpt domain-containing protein [Bdellovibrionota bacterium]|nr:Hpt domain-containing protein [Bdellovibrionota bacterium]
MDTLLDFEHIEMITDGDKNFLKQLIDIYKEDCEERLVTIKNAIEAKSSSDLYREAHTFKGASSNLGAIQATKLSANLENLGRDESFENSENIYENLKEIYHNTVIELENFLNS